MTQETRLRLPERGSFEELLRPARVEVASLLGLSRNPATEPCWSAGVYRFDDPEQGRAGAFGTCYTASAIGVAFAESVIHECGRFVDGRFELPAPPSSPSAHSCASLASDARHWCWPT